MSKSTFSTCACCGSELSLRGEVGSEAVRAHVGLKSGAKFEGPVQERLVQIRPMHDISRCAKLLLQARERRRVDDFVVAVSARLRLRGGLPAPLAGQRRQSGTARGKSWARPAASGKRKCVSFYCSNRRILSDRLRQREPYLDSCSDLANLGRRLVDGDTLEASAGETDRCCLFVRLAVSVRFPAQRSDC